MGFLLRKFIFLRYIFPILFLYLYRRYTEGIPNKCLFEGYDTYTKDIPKVYKL